MSKDSITPSTLGGIKRYAQQLRARDGLILAKALDRAAQAGGFQNYTHARRQLASAAIPSIGHEVFISVCWRARETKEDGREILAVRVATPLPELVKPAYLKSARHFRGFRITAPDHFEHELTASSVSDARRRACAAARTLVFMEATGLRPSAGGVRAYPGADLRNAVPHHDHASEWFDPQSRAYVYVDEPYASAAAYGAEERAAWTDRVGWRLERSAWPGMYNPDGGCELYLATDPAKGLDLDAILTRLAALSPPIVEAGWNGRSLPLVPWWLSPAATAAAGAPGPPPKPRAKRRPNVTVGYRTTFARSERRRPAARMPVDAHKEVGRLLKSVMADSSMCKNGVRKRVGAVRCELDDWVQMEYDRTELPDAVFFNLYYHEDDLPPAAVTGQALLDRHAGALETAKGLLVLHYPDCAPLRTLLGGLDKSISTLRA